MAIWAEVAKVAAGEVVKAAVGTEVLGTGLQVGARDLHTHLVIATEDLDPWEYMVGL